MDMEGQIQVQTDELKVRDLGMKMSAPGVGIVGTGPGVIAMIPAEGIGYYPLYLTVDRTEFLSGPCLHFFHSGGIKAQKETFPGFFLCHGLKISCRVYRC